MKADLTVYTAACWWRDSDPHTSVVALTPKACETAIDEAIRAMAEQAATDEWCVCGEEVTDETEAEHEDCGIDAQAWSGVHPESLRYILKESNPRQRREIVEDLRAQGKAYLEMC